MMRAYAPSRRCAPLRARIPSSPASTSRSERPNALASSPARRSGPKPGVWALRTTSAGSPPVRSAHRARRPSRRSSRRQPVRRAPAPVAVARRIEDDGVVPAFAALLARNESLDVVDDPADRPVGEAGQLRVATGPGDGRPRAVDVGHGRARGRSGQRHCPGVGEEIEDLRRPAEPRDGIPDPRPVRCLLRKEPDLARVGRSKLEPQVAIVDDPRLRLALAECRPADISIESEVCARPGRRVARRRVGRRRGPVHHELAEPLQPAPVAGVEQLVASAISHGTMMEEERTAVAGTTYRPTWRTPMTVSL